MVFLNLKFCKFVILYLFPPDSQPKDIDGVATVTAAPSAISSSDPSVVESNPLSKFSKQANANRFNKVIDDLERKYYSHTQFCEVEDSSESESSNNEMEVQGDKGNDALDENDEQEEDGAGKRSKTSRQYYEGHFQSPEKFKTNFFLISIGKLQIMIWRILLLMIVSSSTKLRSD